jgi:hypothetical protein
MLDLVHQSISTPQTAYEISFGDALEALLKQRIHDLPGLVTGLNAAGFAPPEGGAWTEDRLTAEFAKLGA